VARPSWLNLTMNILSHGYCPGETSTDGPVKTSNEVRMNFERQSSFIRTSFEADIIAVLRAGGALGEIYGDGRRNRAWKPSLPPTADGGYDAAD